MAQLPNLAMNGDLTTCYVVPCVLHWLLCAERGYVSRNVVRNTGNRHIGSRQVHQREKLRGAVTTHTAMLLTNIPAQDSVMLVPSCTCALSRASEVHAVRSRTTLITLILRTPQWCLHQETDCAMALTHACEHFCPACLWRRPQHSLSRTLWTRNLESAGIAR